MADRREHVRFEVSGRLWASLERDERAILRNIAAGGALIEATVAPPMHTSRIAYVRLRPGGADLTVAVRHMRPAPDRPGDDRYLIGVEFINLSRSDTAMLEAFVRDWSERAGSPANQNRPRA